MNQAAVNYFAVSVLKGFVKICTVVAIGALVIGGLAAIGWVLPETWLAWIPGPGPGKPEWPLFVVRGVVAAVCLLIGLSVVVALARVGAHDKRNLNQ
jgi:amino acid transporter